MPHPLTILVVHNHYQQRGGEDSVFETECAMLRGAGHTVICYEKHNDEINSGEKRLAASGQRLGGEKGLAASGQGLARQDDRNDSPAPPLEPSTYHLAPFRAFRVFRSSLSLFVRTIWNHTTYREITALIHEHRPDIVHCHNTFPLISPSVYWAAARQGVPVVQTLHNYRLVCINPYLYRDGHICEDCLGRSPLRGVMHRCYRGSFAASFTVAAMLMVHRILGTYRNKVTTYIALTEFGRNKFIEARLCSPDKVVVKPNAVAAGAASAEVQEGSGVGVQEEETLSGALSGALSNQEQGQRVATSPTKPTSSTPTAAPVEGKPCHSSNHDARLATPDAKFPVSIVQSQSVDQPHSAQPPESPVSNFKFPVSTPHSRPFASIRGSSNPATVLYAGRLSPEKGVDILIAAWKLFLAQSNQQPTTSSLDQQEDRNDSPASQLVPSTYPLVPSPSPAATLVPSTYHLEPKDQPRLLIIGDGPERTALEATSANIHSIHFLGALPKDQVVKHMGQASLLVFPSVWQETFGLTILEAASLGTTAIVSDIGGQASLVEDGATGFTFRSGSAESLAETLAKALADPDRLAELGRHAQARFLAGDCPPERNVAALIRVYARCDINLCNHI